MEWNGLICLDTRIKVLCIKRYSKIVTEENYEIVKRNVNDLKVTPELHKTWPCDCYVYISKNIKDWDDVLKIMHDKLCA